MKVLEEENKKLNLIYKIQYLILKTIYIHQIQMTHTLLTILYYISPSQLHLQSKRIFDLNIN